MAAVTKTDREFQIHERTKDGKLIPGAIILVKELKWGRFNETKQTETFEETEKELIRMVREWGQMSDTIVNFVDYEREDLITVREFMAHATN